MAKIVFVIAALCLVQIANANTEPGLFTELSTQVEGTLKTLHTNFLSWLDVSDNDQLADKIVTESKSFSKKLGDLVNEISEKAKSNTGELDQASQQYIEKMKAVIQKFEQENPEVSQYKETIETELNKLVHETNEFSKSFTSDTSDVRKGLKEAVSHVFENTKEFAEKVTSTVESAVAKH